MKDRFEIGDSVVVATLGNIKEELNNWAVDEGLQTGKIYQVSNVKDDNWLKLVGCKYIHPGSRFNLACNADRLREIANYVRRFISELDAIGDAQATNAADKGRMMLDELEAYTQKDKS